MSDKFTYRSGPVLLRPFPVASGTVVEIGMLMRLSSGKVIKMTSASENQTFVGVAAQAHASTDASGTINLYLPLPITVFEYDLDTATTITIMDALQVNGSQTLKKSTTDQVARAMESKLSATKILCSFVLPAVTSGIRLIGDQS